MPIVDPQLRRSCEIEGIDRRVIDRQLLRGNYVRMNRSAVFGQSSRQKTFHHVELFFPRNARVTSRKNKALARQPRSFR